MHDVLEKVLRFLVHLGIAALVVLVGYLLAALARRLVKRVLRKHEEQLGPSVVRLLASSAYFLLIAVSVGLALIAAGIPATFVSALTIVVLALLALALQQSIANFAATVSVLMFQPYKRDELVETMGHLGTVREILLFTTVLRLPDNRLVTLPNNQIQSNGLVNYSRLGRVRADVALTIGFDQDLERARSLILAIAGADERILADPPCGVSANDLGENGVGLLVTPYVQPDAYLSVPGDLRERIKQRFDAEGIRFAVQVRDVTLHDETPDVPAEPAKA
ncbi:MAG TPA: mechanosensitive ion channel family protein [Actinomycetota bacterium]|nr:mechanosensitive ion channel family protein [Actinomycetota bacterium]